MTKLLCLSDSYLKECPASVVAVDGNRVQIDQTVFYATGGGVPCDTGILEKEGAAFKVLEARKENGIVWHALESASGLNAGDKVAAKIDWVRRYKLMRMHTAAHVLGSAMFSKGVLFTGNQLGEEASRIDFDCPAGMEKAMIEEGVAEANKSLLRDVELKIYNLPREEALKMPGMVKLADKLPPAVTELRIVEIPGIDTQADGGCHVKNLNEVGQIQVDRVENKGSRSKRVYFSLEQP